MGVAQRLYEGIEIGNEGTVGLITYMRTDSTRVSEDALAEVRGMISERYGPEYLPAAPNTYKTKKDAQDAHEAIRPTSALRTPDSLEKLLAEDELKLYRLIWMRSKKSSTACRSALAPRALGSLRPSPKRGRKAMTCRAY